MRIRQDGSTAYYPRLGSGKVFLHKNLASGVEYKFYPFRKIETSYQIVPSHKLMDVK